MSEDEEKQKPAHQDAQENQWELDEHADANPDPIADGQPRWWRAGSLWAL
jgi:hypothetical protein